MSGVNGGDGVSYRNRGQVHGPEESKKQQLSGIDLGQAYPHHYPHRVDFEGVEDDPLGTPMTITEVARILGCSQWTVRQRHLRAGLPHFRIGRTGKLMFYRKQIVHWILENQKRKGGELK